MPDALDIRPLRHDDIAAALRLSTQAGWNQIAADWSRLIGLWPGGCIAGWHGGQLVATATLATYGHDLAWVGMVLVDEACRGRGFGGQIMDAILNLADRSGVKTVGLDATDAGRPVYLKRGFVDVCGIDRRVLRAAAAVDGHAADWRAGALVSENWPAVLSLDLRISGLDRSALLTRLRDEPDVILRVFLDGDSITGFAFCRPGRGAKQIGPVVAESAQIALEMIDSVTFLSANPTPILLDTFHDSPISASLDQRRFIVTRRLTRMTRPARIEIPQPFCAAGLELG